MSARKLDAKAFAHQRQRRRQWLTFVRMCRYGVNNFSRNAWLTIAATAVMTITLLTIFTTFVARNVLVDTADEIRAKVNMSIYVKYDTSDKDAETVKSHLEKLSTVKSVTYISPKQAAAQNAEENKANQDVLEAIVEASNKLPGTLRISVTDINDTSQLDDFVKSDDVLKRVIDPAHAPSFAGSSRTTIESIGRWVSFADKVGIGASAVFVAISSLIVFNTIRMAIFSRKEEIQMMKLIGADRSFIRGPFIVEAVVYGFIAAILATGLGLLGLYSVRDKLVGYGIAVVPTIDFMTVYIGFIVLAMVVIGALIGIISSLFATRRYLKV